MSFEPGTVPAEHVVIFLNDKPNKAVNGNDEGLKNCVDGIDFGNSSSERTCETGY
jgi:hypothetical protein